jgi:hypothetical protein
MGDEAPVVSRRILTEHPLGASAVDVYLIGDGPEVDGDILPCIVPINHGTPILQVVPGGRDTHLA